MSGLGDTSLTKRNPVNKFLSIPTKEDSKGYSVHVSVNFTAEQGEQLELLKLTMRENQASVVVRQVFEDYWKDHGEEITEKAEKIKEIIS